MTSLALQLQKLAVSHTQSILGEDKKRPSLLFDPKEAANLDKEAVFGIGLNGLEELENLDETFQEFEETLFSETAQDFERSTQTKDVNQKLNKTISHFLIKLSPYFLLKPAHKVIEWLVYRYHIHYYNIDDLLLCILPYHETKIFVRAIQLLQLNDETNRWHWLQPIQKPGVPLPRTTLVTHCYKDPSFLNFICDMVQKFLKVHSTKSSMNSPLRILFNFFTTTLIGALNQGTIKDSMIAQLLPFIVKGLKSKSHEYKVAVYMILSQLASKAKLKSSFFDSLLPIMAKHIPATLVREAVTCLLVIYQYQNLTKIPKRTYKYLCKLPGMGNILIALSKSFLITPFLQPFLKLLISDALTDTTDEDLSPEDVAYASLLDHVIMGCELDDKVKKLIARSLLDNFMSLKTGQTSEDIDKASFKRRLKHFIGVVEKRYPVAMDLTIEERMKQNPSKREQTYLQEFVSLSISTAKHSILPKSETSLMLGLNHPKCDIRLLAVQQLKQLAEERGATADEFLIDSVMTRLQDDDPRVVSCLLEAGEVLQQVLGAKRLYESTMKIMRTHFGKSAWTTVVKQCVKHLTSLHDDDLEVQVTTLLLPYILLTSCKAEKIDLVKSIFQSEHAKKSRILSSAATHWMKMSQKGAKEAEMGDFWLGHQNVAVVQKIAEALSKHVEDRENVMLLLLSECQTEGPLQSAYTFITLSLMAELVGKLKSNHLRIQYGLKCLEVVKENSKLFKALKSSKDEGNQPTALFKKSLDTIASCSCVPLDAVIDILQRIISTITMPSTLNSQNWWKITSSDDEKNVFLKFSIACFDLLTLSMDNKDVKQQEGYKILFEHFMKTYFIKKSTLFKFLAIPVSSSAMIREEGTMPISVILQARALHIAIACLADTSSQELMQLLAEDSVVVPSLLVALTSPHSAIRSAATICLTSIHNAASDLNAPFAFLVHQLTNRSEELEADASYLPQALYMIFSKAFKAIKQETLTPKKLKRKQKAQESAQSSSECLVGAIVNSECPCFVQDCLLESLSQVTSPELLTKLLPLLEQLLTKSSENKSLNQSETKCVHYLIQRYTDTITSLFRSSSRVQQVFYKALKASSGHHPEYMSIQGVVLQQITKEFFASMMSEDLQQELFSELVDLWVNTKDAKTANSISRVLKALPLTANQIVTELVKVKNTTKAATIREVKRIRRTSKPDIEPVLTAVDTYPWQRVTLVMEMLQAKKKVQDAVKLIPVIFDIMRRCLNLDDHQASEYLKQLLLSCILNVCNKIEGDQQQLKDLKTSQHFKVDLIVQCVRTSENPQTHHHALILLTMAAKLFPDLVLHNIMSVFTFMGANIMRQDDSYSFQVISKMVETVIPALIAAHAASEDKEKLDSVVASVIQVFVDAYPHIPEHRRLPIFSKLVSTLGSSSYLWITLILLLDGSVLTETGKPQEEQETKTANYVHPMVTLCLDLSNQFEPDVQIITAKMFMQYLVRLPQKDKDAPVRMREVTRRVKKTMDDSKDDLINVAQHTAKQIRYFRYTVSAFIVQILNDKRFIAKVIELDEQASSNMVPHYQLFLEENLRYINHVARLTGQTSDQPTGKFWRIILNKAYEILDKINSLLPSNVFVSVVSGLMKNELPIVRRKAMELLNNKMQHSKFKIEDEEIPLFLGLVAQLLSVVVSTAPGSEAEDEVAINKQTALFSLKVLCRTFGSSHPQTFKPILPVLTELFSQPAANPQVTASGLMCLAELCQNLRAHVIPSLPLFMPRLMQVLNKADGLNAASTDTLLVSSVTVVHKVVESLPHFISPYVLDIMMKIVQLSSDLPSDEATQKTQLYQRLKAVRLVLATKLPSRVLLPTVAKCYEVVTTQEKLYLGPLMSILTDHITDISRDNLASHHNQFLDFFLQALNYRSQNSQLSLSDVETMEGHVIGAVVAMVMRLSEATFKPMFYKLFDWATRDEDNKDRLLVFYRLADGIADKLKTLFTLFAGHIVKNAANLMEENNKSKTETGSFGSSEEGIAKSCQLLGYIFGVLHKCFMYDNEGFVNKERFDTLLQPLIDQVENELGPESEYEQRINDLLVPCVGQFALASGDDSSWKPLNYQICLKTRNSSPKVRFAALKMIEELSKKLGEDYMVLLPETIQFLAELLEDDSYEVEQQCQEVISHMEKVLGEPLQKYF